MSVRSFVERTVSLSPAQRSCAAQMQRFDRLIDEAETRIGEQEARIRQASLAGRGTALDEFDLQKMHLLLAILREGRERVAGGLRPAAPSASG